MGLRDEFTEERGPTLAGLEGERWKDTRVGDFIRGTLVRASVQDGTTVDGAPEKKVVVVLRDVVGKMDGASVSAPVATIITSSGRGSAMVEALDDAPVGAGVQVLYAGTKPGKTTGNQKLWCVKVWGADLDFKAAPLVVVDMRTWGAKKEAAWAAPSEKVAAV